MDIARDPKPKTRKRIIQWSVGALALIGVTMALRNLEPAAPGVDAATVWMDTVMHGTMVRQVRGPGTLVPEQMRWITALTAGRVEQIIVLPGTEIDEGTVIIRMSNPDVDIALLQARQAAQHGRSDPDSNRVEPGDLAPHPVGAPGPVAHPIAECATGTGYQPASLRHESRVGRRDRVSKNPRRGG